MPIAVATRVSPSSYEDEDEDVTERAFREVCLSLFSFLLYLKIGVFQYFARSLARCICCSCASALLLVLSTHANEFASNLFGTHACTRIGHANAFQGQISRCLSHRIRKVVSNAQELARAGEKAREKVQEFIRRVSSTDRERRTVADAFERR